MDNKEYLSEIGRKIKTARKSKKMSLRAFSKHCKLDLSNLWFVENGGKNTKMLTLKIIADSLNMDVKDFL